MGRYYHRMSCHLLSRAHLLGCVFLTFCFGVGVAGYVTNAWLVDSTNVNTTEGLFRYCSKGSCDTILFNYKKPAYETTRFLGGAALVLTLIVIWVTWGFFCSGIRAFWCPMLFHLLAGVAGMVAALMYGIRRETGVLTIAYPELGWSYWLFTFAHLTTIPVSCLTACMYAQGRQTTGIISS